MILIRWFGLVWWILLGCEGQYSFKKQKWKVDFTLTYHLFQVQQIFISVGIIQYQEVKTHTCIQSTLNFYEENGVDQIDCVLES